MQISFDWQNPQARAQGEALQGGGVGGDRGIIDASRMNSRTIIDISGKVKDNLSYGDQGRFNQQVIQEVGAEEYTLLQRNFNVIMSNSMSEQDYLAMEEEGFNVYGMEPEQLSTILDKIKAVLAQSGTKIEGFNDNLSDRELEAAAGSQGQARAIERALKKADVPVTEENIAQVEEALEKALSLSAPGEGNKAYLVAGGLSPTLKNLYRAGYSSVNIDRPAGSVGGAAYASGSYGRQGEAGQGFRQAAVSKEAYPGLEASLRQRLSDSGFGAQEETVEAARWLMDNGLAVTKENIGLLQEIEALSFPPDEEVVISQAARALSEGKSVWDIPVQGETVNLYARAREMYERYRKLPEEAADYAVDRELPLTLVNMEGCQGTAFSGKEEAVESYEKLAARKTLEEVRLKMTVEANLKLLQSGFSIDTAPMEELIAGLEGAIRDWESSLFGSQEASGKGKLYTDALSAVQELSVMPLAVSGKVALMEISPTLEQTVKEGRSLQEKYRAAGESYETLMTSPRADLGDSLHKAFRHIDGLLQEMDLPLTEENQRGVRILGYNRMEVTQENLRKVQEADRQVCQVIQGLKPGLTLEMIREGENPLEMSLQDLQEYIQERQADFDRQMKDYSKFLYKLDRQGGITQEERKAYVGIYRLVRQIEKSDGAAIGSLISQNAEINLNTLLSAVRTGKAKITDIRVDDSVGLLQTVKTKGLSISEQIEEGFAAIQESLPKNRTLRQGMETVEAVMQETQPEEEYAGGLLQGIRQSLTGEKELSAYLRAWRQPVTIDNLLSAAGLTGERGSAFRQLRAWEKRVSDESGLLEKAERFLEGIEEPEGREASYQGMLEEAQQVLENAVTALGNEAGQGDLREIRLLHKQLHLASSLSREENYEIPVQIGEELTSINLKLIHGRQKVGEVKITSDTESHGRVEARFKAEADFLEGSILTRYMDKKEGLEAGKPLLTELINEALQETEIQLKGIFFGVHEGLYLNRMDEEEQARARAQEEPVDTLVLYRVAKAFITYLRGAK